MRETARVPNSNGSHGRPILSFRSKSPVPRVKYRPIKLENERNGRWVDKHSEPEDESESEPELRPEAELEEHEADPEIVISDEVVYDHMSDSNDSEPDESENIENGDELDQMEAKDLTGLKLVELRALAKSQGVKGFSKIKKKELLEVLCGSSV